MHLYNPVNHAQSVHLIALSLFHYVFLPGSLFFLPQCNVSGLHKHIRRRRETKPFLSEMTEPEIQRPPKNCEDEKTETEKRIFNSDEKETLESVCVSKGPV